MDKGLDLSTLALAVIIAIIGFLVFGGGNGQEETYPTLILEANVDVVHPPQNIEISLDRNGFPSTTQFFYKLGDTPLIEFDGARTVFIHTWPTDIAAEAVLDGKTISSSSLSLALRNETPRFFNLYIGLPEEREPVSFHLYHRRMGCAASGEPTLITGIADPDYTATNIASDETDNWEYQVYVIDEATGDRETVYYRNDAGNIVAMELNDWTRNPAFVWMPFAFTVPTPLPPVITVAFPNITPRVGPLSVEEETEDLNETGYGWPPASELESMRNVQPMCGGTPVVPDVEPVELRVPNKTMYVSVREYGTIHTSKYLIYATPNSCQ